MITVAAAGIADFLVRRPALALGPSFSLGEQLCAALAKTLGTPPTVPPDFQKLILQHKPDTKTIEDFLDTRPEPPLVAQWGAHSWPAVLALSLDSRFDARLRSHQDKNPSRLPVLAIDDLDGRSPDRVLPIFRLVGTLGRAAAGTSTPLYLQRRAKWRFALQAFASVTRGAPLILLGFEDAPSLLLDLLAELQAMRTLQPQAICLFSSDPLLEQDPSIIETIEALGKTVLLDMNPQTFINQMGKVSTTTRPAGSPRPILDLNTLAEHVVVVADHLSPTAAPTEMNRLLDLLSAPASLDWNPFAFDLDLPRTATSEVARDIRSLLSARDMKSQVYVVSGPAVTGKTTLLKRISFDLAKSDRHVLWLRPVYASDAPDVIRQVFKAASPVTRRWVVVMDDPFAFPSINPLDVSEAARAAQVSILLLTACRTTDRVLSNDFAITGGLPLVGEYPMPTELDQSEYDLLPIYLSKKLRLADSPETAKRLLPKAASADLLALLHLLLPHTRKHIEQSLKDEYFRLGDISTFTPVLQRTYQAGGMVLQHAYRLVGVATYYRSPLPLEILVQALGVAYAEWLESVPLNSPAWGLLYPDQWDTTHTVTYRTRNNIVADGLRKIVNGGSVNRSGEVQALNELLSVCNGTQSLYREFAIKVLVNNPTFEDLPYVDGLQLYDTALQSLPLRDRTLLHHKARWMREYGPDVMAVFEVLDETLATPQNPYRQEMDEHIHTTYARTILDALEQRKISVEAAKRGVFDHLSRATSDEFVNVHATHVAAETTLEMLSQLPKDDSQAVDRAALTTQALDEIDRTMQLIAHGSDVADVAGDIQMLEVAQGKLLETVEYDAVEQWTKFHTQAGFVATAQRMLSYARTREKGTDYNTVWQYVQDSVARVQNDGGVVSPQLHEIVAMTYYRWRIQRVVKAGAEPLDWPMFRGHVESALPGRDAKKSAMLQYLRALALCHEGQWAEASGIFQKLRSSKVQRGILHLTRDFMLTDDGARRRIQGSVKAGASAVYFASPEIGTDCLADRKGPWPLSEQEQVHSYVRFSMAGPMAFRAL